MNKIGFVFSGIFVTAGVLTLLTTQIIDLVLPQIGRAAFQAAMAGRYSPSDYYINFLGVNLMAIAMIIIGIVFGYRFYKSDR